MNTHLCRLLATGYLLLSAALHGQTINWGSETFSDLRDSNGLTLDNTFVFELGAFDPGFSPIESNVGTWLDNWNVFDQAAYNPAIGLFSSTTEMTDDGLSTSQWLNADITSFEGLQAYLWIRKGDQPVAGSEWLVVRADNWTFPIAIPGCCDNALPVEFSVSDLTVTNTPNWGNQEGQQGPGVYTNTGAYTLQTYTFPVPEPSSAALLTLVSLCTLLRRKR